jgi:hypothetical protein
MQTFLPYPDFLCSLRSLDYRRLGKQRLEALQILKIITQDYTLISSFTHDFYPSTEIQKHGTTKMGWQNHPAVLMWKGYEMALANYYNSSLDVWKEMGYKQNMLKATIHKMERAVMPDWFGNPDFHASHRSNLLRKNREFYSKYTWAEPDNLEYVWPVISKAVDSKS